MLKTRVITALALVAGLLPALFLLDTKSWALLMAVVAGIAAWEWGGMVRFAPGLRLGFGALVFVLAAVTALTLPELITLRDAGGATPTLWIHALAVAFWCFLVPFWLRAKWVPGVLGGAFAGALVILPAWLAMVQLRAVEPWLLFALMAVPSAADIAAYFSGKRFGKNKLAPQISPGKTREGAYGAILGVCVYGGIMVVLFKVPNLPWPVILGLLVAITMISIIGDLLESLLKRQAGIKDSSSILPGHGGVMDRIDSLTSTLPCFALIWMLFA